MLVRTFYKVLAFHLLRFPLDDRQRGFRTFDGCTDNIVLMDNVLRYHHTKFKKAYIAVVDMKNAFGSVAYVVIIQVLIAKSVPQRFVNYFASTYLNSRTFFQHGDWNSRQFTPTCGVKQGDPLSLPTFNLVIDEFLLSVPQDVGVNLDGLSVNFMALADDFVLNASSAPGLQHLINHTVSYLGKVGLERNINKCSTIAIRTIPKKKKTAVDSTVAFKVNGVY